MQNTLFRIWFASRLCTLRKWKDSLPPFYALFGISIYPRRVWWDVFSRSSKFVTVFALLDEIYLACVRVETILLVVELALWDNFRESSARDKGFNIAVEVEVSVLTCFVINLVRCVFNSTVYGNSFRFHTLGWT